MTNQRDSRGVRMERTGWRDHEISNRHRLWDADCPMVDIDFLAVEYNRNLPVALIDYKASLPYTINLQASNYATLAGMATRLAIPFMVAFYSPTYWWFNTLAGNDLARNTVGQSRWFSEREYVALLYQLRKLPLPTDLELSDFNPRPEILEGVS